MNITKRIANQLHRGMLLRKFTYQEIADQCEVSRETVRMWVVNQRIPDKYIATVHECTGIKFIKG